MSQVTDPDPPLARAAWDEAIRQHDRRVFLSILALGVPPERAREIAQATWARLYEQHQKGALDQIELPGLAIRQARFLALNDRSRSVVEGRVLAAVPDPPPQPDALRIAAGREQIARVLAALATCPPMARKVFQLVYATPGGSAAKAAAEVGLSLQRVRQILCETRRHIRESIETTGTGGSERTGTGGSERTGLGRSDERTGSGRSDERTGSGRSDERTGPGRSDERTGLGRSGKETV